MVAGRWLWLFRHAQPLDIDEAGYIGLAVVDHAAYLRRGVAGLVAAIWAPSNQAPLTTALAAIVFCVTGVHPIVAFIVPVLAGAGTIAATWGVGGAIASRRLGLAGAALVACCPTIILHARSFVFALPATCIATIAVLALLRSGRMRDGRWAALFGVCCGLLPLARTMTVAFLPALLLGALAATLADAANRRARLLHLLGSVLLAAGTAALWLGFNGRLVFAYLFSFGYGVHAADYGPAESLFSVARLIAIAQTLVREVYLPTALLLAAGGACLAIIWIGCIVRDGPWRGIRRTLQARVLPMVIYVAGALAALASSPNQGDGFYVPIVPCAIVLALWSGIRVARSVPARAAVVGAATLVGGAGALPSLDLRLAAARPWSIDLPLLGRMPVTDGRGYIGIYEAGGGYVGNDPRQPVDRDTGRRWVSLSTTLAGTILETTQAGPPVLFGFRQYLVNVNTVSLAALTGARRVLDLRQIDPATTGNTVAGDMAWLQGDGGRASLLLTVEGSLGEIHPVVDGARLAQAAVASGFRPSATVAMPSGQAVTVWRRAGA